MRIALIDNGVAGLGDYYAASPGIEYQMWSGVSHFVMMDEPQKFNETVLAFLKKNNLLKK